MKEEILKQLTAIELGGLAGGSYVDRLELILESVVKELLEYSDEFDTSKKDIIKTINNI